MPSPKSYDAIIVGAGPNGLAAAITLARAGRSVLVLEANKTIGGGVRSEELTLPGFMHDTCAAIVPLTVASPFFRSVPLKGYGVELVFPPAAFAHPLDDGTPAILERSVDATAETLGRDARAYRALMRPLVADADKLTQDLLGPFPFPPRHPLVLARFGIPALMPARTLAQLLFKEEKTRALFAGVAAHSMLPLEASPTSAFGLILTMLGHSVGWPLIRGGAQNLANALAAYLRTLGGEIETNHRVESFDELPPARAYLFDVTPRQLLKIVGDKFSSRYRRGLEKFRYGLGVFKIDFALNAPISWKAPGVARAGTVHLGGTLEEIAQSEREAWAGSAPQSPYMIVVQQTPFDPSRAPNGKHTAWAYCHVPNGSTFDMRERMIAQIERFAPGFHDLILATTARSPAEMEQHNANYVGGDINGGAQDLGQLWTRPVMQWNPYITSAKNIFICSSSTPPGGGVHGMSGYHAARAAMRGVLK